MTGDAAVDTMTVKVRDNAREAALWGNGWTASMPTAFFRTVTISAFCPRCGGRRGTPHPHRFHVDDEWHTVDVWSNSCGHTDMYDAVLAEADREESRPCAD